MSKKEIIFFDDLGFGWVVDKTLARKLHAAGDNEELIVEKTLADLLRQA